VTIRILDNWDVRVMLLVLFINLQLSRHFARIWFTLSLINVPSLVNVMHRFCSSPQNAFRDGHMHRITIACREKRATSTGVNEFEKCVSSVAALTTASDQLFHKFGKIYEDIYQCILKYCQWNALNRHQHKKSCSTLHYIRDALYTKIKPNVIFFIHFCSSTNL
jgi:hypothetical protein